MVGFAAHDRELGKDVRFADIYHSANRFATGGSILPIVLPRSQIWCFDRNRLLLGSELLGIQGQENDGAGFSQAQLTDLAGNALLGLS